MYKNIFIYLINRLSLLCVCLIAGGLFVCSLGYAADTGDLHVTQNKILVNQGTPYSHWQNTGNITTTGATIGCSDDNSCQTDEHYWYDLSANIPAGATINGVVVNALTSFEPDPVGTSGEIYLVYNDAQIGNRKTLDYPDVEASQVLGGSADLWGATLTRDIVNDVSFGIALHAGYLSSTSVIARDLNVIIYYTPAASGITVSGTAYTDTSQATTLKGKAISLKVNGAGTYTATTDAGNGTFSFTGVSVGAGDVVSVYLTSTEKGNVVTNAVDASTDITGISLYQNTVTVRSDKTGTPLTITDTSIYDSTQNATDMLFDAVTGAPNTLIVAGANALYLEASQSFTPGGNITVGSGGIAVGASGVWTASGSETITNGGSLAIASGATFTKGSGALTFNGGGTSTLTDSTAAGQDLGAVELSNNTTVQEGAAAKMTSLTIGAGSTWDLAGNNFSFTGAAAVANSGTFKLMGNETLTNVTDLGTAAGTVTYYGNNTSGPLTLKNFSYFNLNIADVNGTPATYRPVGTLTVNGNLALSGGTMDMATGNPASNWGGSLTISGGTWTRGTGIMTFVGTNNSTANAYTITSNAQSLATIVVDGAEVGAAALWDTWTLQDDLTAGKVTLTDGKLVDNAKTVTVNGTAGTTGTTADVIIADAASLLTSTGTWVMASNGNIASGSASGDSRNKFNIFQIANSVTTTRTSTFRAKKLVMGTSSVLNGNYYLVLYAAADDCIDMVVGSSSISSGSLWIPQQVTPLSQKAFTTATGDLTIAYGLVGTTMKMTGDWTLGGALKLESSAAQNTEAKATILTTHDGTTDHNLSVGTYLKLGNVYAQYLNSYQSKVLLNGGTHTIGTYIQAPQSGTAYTTAYIDFGSSNTTVNSYIDFHSMDVNLGSSSLTVQGDIDWGVLKTVDIDPLTAGLQADSTHLYDYSAGTSTVTLSGTSQATLTAAEGNDEDGVAIQELANLVINKTGASGSDRVMADATNGYPLDIIYNVTVTDGVFDLSVYNDNVNIGGVFAIGASGAFTSGTATVTLSGTAASYTSANITSANTTWTGGTLNIQTDLDQTLPSGETYGHLQLGRSSGAGTTIYTMPASTITGNLTVDADAVVNLSGNLVVGGNAVINGQVNTNGYNLTITGTVDLNGTLDGSRNGGPAESIITTGAMDATGGTFTGGNADLELTSGSTTMVADWALTNLTVPSGATLVTDGYELTLLGNLNVDGTLDASNGAGTDTTITVAGNVDLTNGTFTAGASTFVFNGTTTLTSHGEALNHVTLDGILITADNADINGSLTVLNNNASTLNITDDTVLVAGDINLTNLDTFTVTNSTVTLNSATADQTITTNDKHFNNLTVNNTNANAAADNIIISGTLFVDGNLPLTDGELDINSSDPNVTLSGNLAIAADASLSKGSGTLTLAGAGNLTDLSAGQDLGAVSVNNNSTRTQASAMTMTALTIDSGSTYDLAGNNFTFSGAAAVANSGTFKLKGNETLTNVNNLGTAAGTVTYYGDNTVGPLPIQNFAYNNLNIADANGTTAVYQPGGTLTVNGNFVLSGGTLDMATNNRASNFGGNFTITTGTWTKGSGAVTFTTNSQINANGQNLGVVVFD